LDNTGEALAAVLRPGNAGSNTATDHIAVTDLALAQLPDAQRHGVPILVSADGAGATRAWLAHLRAQRATGVDLEFSVGFTMTVTVQTAILALAKQAWTQAINADGSLRDGADVAELTGMLGDLTAAGWPAGMRVIVRRERPHPGAQLSFTDVDGWRFQAFATDTRIGQLAHLEARHRAHARVEDRIRCAKNTGLNRLPSRQFAINAAWVELALTAADLIAWTQTTLLHGDLTVAEPATFALPAAARRRPDHPRTTTAVRAHRLRLALARATRRRVRPPRRPAPADHLTDQPHDHPQQTDPEPPTTAPAHPRTPRSRTREQPPEQDRLVRDQSLTERPGLTIDSPGRI